MTQETTEELRRKIRFYELVLDNIRNGVMITEPSGRIIFFSKAYGNFLGIDARQAIGKHCREVVENTRMETVARTGLPEINHPHRIKGRDMVVQRIPIQEEGRTIAVYGQVMFEDVRDVQALAKKLTVLESKLELYEKELTSLRSAKYTIKHIIGRSGEMAELKKMALKAAKTSAPVLIMGESGTGKELFAHAIHYAGERRAFPFIRLNCAAIPRDLLESELFGYEPGAFSGAGSKSKPGKFELAHQGTMFLDEIGDLPLEMQPKLLRVIEEKETERLGGNRLIHSNFRLITATHAPLEKLVAQGRFRKDLYYRLNVIPIAIPPLRDRKEDIPLLADHLIAMLNQDLGTNVTRLTSEAQERFRQYDWPGNVRELINVLERVIYSIDGETIQLHHLPIFLQTIRRKTVPGSASLKRLKEETEKEALALAIQKAHYNKNRAARDLGIHRTALYKKMKKYEIPLAPGR
ncbi:MAG: sigma 54-interacting transcriptional regulator [Desulfobacterota bacterium]|jgi:transcriptional regulator with PAS, ATPase and Fis domain|nr:sigma 54-interacting transcriptional regulator [Thermodesulfobacteriota bacterium]